MRTKLRLLLACGAAIVTCAPGASSALEPLPPLPISFVVGTHDGAPLVDDAWIDGQVEMANRVYAPHGISFVRAGLRPMTRPAIIRSTADRDSLAAETERHVINAFVVEHIGDASDPDDAIGGRHWRARGRQYVIVARDCWRDTLAHEIGHYLGHRGHSNVVGNLMSYLRVLPVSQIDAAQSALMRRTARRYLRSGELQPLGASINARSRDRRGHAPDARGARPRPR